MIPSNFRSRVEIKRLDKCNTCMYFLTRNDSTRSFSSWCLSVWNNYYVVYALTIINVINKFPWGDWAGSTVLFIVLMLCWEHDGIKQISYMEYAKVQNHGIFVKITTHKRYLMLIKLTRSQIPVSISATSGSLSLRWYITMGHRLHRWRLGIWSLISNFTLNFTCHTTTCLCWDYTLCHVTFL